MTALWEVDPTGEAPARRLTRSAKGEGTPAFTPGGDLLFVSARPDPDAEEGKDDTALLWLLPAGGGEARVAGSRPGGIDAVVAAARADTVAVLSSTMPSAVTAEDDEQRRKARKDKDVAAILHSSYPIRFWDDDLGPDQPRLLAARRPGRPTRAIELARPHARRARRAVRGRAGPVARRRRRRHVVGRRRRPWRDAGDRRAARRRDRRAHGARRRRALLLLRPADQSRRRDRRLRPPPPHRARPPAAGPRSSWSRSRAARSPRSRPTGTAGRTRCAGRPTAARSSWARTRRPLAAVPGRRRRRHGRPADRRRRRLHRPCGLARRPRTSTRCGPRSTRRPAPVRLDAERADQQPTLLRRPAPALELPGLARRGDRDRRGRHAAACLARAAAGRRAASPRRCCCGSTAARCTRWNAWTWRWNPWLMAARGLRGAAARPGPVDRLRPGLRPAAAGAAGAARRSPT